LNASKTGAYTLSLEATPDDFGNDLAHAAALPLNQPKEGALDYFNDRDVFAIDVVAGHRYAAFVTSGNFQWPANGYWVEGDEWNARQSFQRVGERSVFAAPWSGTAHFIITGYDPRSYSISVYDITAPPPEEDHQVLSEDDQLDLNFDGTPGEKYFRIDADEHNFYRITFSPNAATSTSF